MSMERGCHECDYVEDIRFNFGSGVSAAEIMFHGNFECPQCGAKRSVTQEEADKQEAEYSAKLDAAYDKLWEESDDGFMLDNDDLW